MDRAMGACRLDLGDEDPLLTEVKSRLLPVALYFFWAGQGVRSRCRAPYLRGIMSAIRNLNMAPFDAAGLLVEVPGVVANVFFV